MIYIFSWAVDAIRSSCWLIVFNDLTLKVTVLTVFLRLSLVWAL